MQLHRANGPYKIMSFTKSHSQRQRSPFHTGNVSIQSWRLSSKHHAQVHKLSHETMRTKRQALQHRPSALSCIGNLLHKHPPPSQNPLLPGQCTHCPISVHHNSLLAWLRLSSSLPVVDEDPWGGGGGSQRGDTDLAGRREHKPRWELQHRWADIGPHPPRPIS